MLQLTFHALSPCPLFAALAHDAYCALKHRDAARLRDACLSITVTDLGASARTRYRLVFECASAAGCSLRVVTQAADMRAALRSGFAVMLGSCTGLVRAARTKRADTSIRTEGAYTDAACS